MKLSYRGILAILGLLAAVLLLPMASPHAQTSSYSGSAAPSYSYGSPTPSPGGSSGSNYNSSLSYFQTGAVSYFSYSGGLKFKVPLSLTGHAFALKYVLNGAPGTINASVLGIVTEIVTEIVTPGSSAQTPLYVLVAASQPPPAGASDWYLADTTASLAPMQHMALDLINTQWFSTDGAANRYFALPDTRAGHSLFAGTGNGNWSQLTSGPVIGSYANYQSLHYFVGRATSDLGLAAALMYVADRSTDHMSQNGATDVRSANLWSFDPNYSLFPFIPARVTLAAREVGHHFTLHGRLGGVVGAPEIVSPCIAVADGAGARLDVSVGVGLQFWITRDAENGTANQPAAPTTAAGATVRNTWVASSPNLTFPGAPCFPPNPQRAAALVAHSFRIGAQPGKRAGHRFSVGMDDGYITTFTADPHPDPVTNVPVPAYVPGTIASWDGWLVANPLPVYTFTAMVDPTRAVFLRDEDVIAGGGLEAVMGVDLNTASTDAFNFDGWQPTQLPPSSPTITVHFPASRSGHAFKLYAQPGSPVSTPWPAGTPPVIFPWPVPAPTVQTVTYAGVEGMADYRLDYFTLNLANPTPYDGGPFELQDATTLAPHDVRAGENDLRNWLLQPDPVNVQISTSRKDHRLQVRHPNGEAFPIVDPFPASGNSLGPNRTIESVSYYYFDATTHAHREMPWYVEDLDTEERIGFVAPATRPTDDALIMWIAVLAPGNLTATAQMDGILLGWSAGQAPTGGGFIIERRESLTSGGQFTAWHELKRVSDSQTAWLDTQLAPGEYAIYRVRAFFGSGVNERHSAPSNRARAARWVKKLDGQWGSPGGDDGTGSNPTLDPPLPPNDGSGEPGIPGDGDGNGDPDNDKDGIVDTNDRYPDDDKRSEDIPVKFYGVIDLNSYLTNPLNVANTEPTHGSSKPLIAIDDENRVSFAGYEDSTLFAPPKAGNVVAPVSQIRTVTWKDGLIIPPDDTGVLGHYRTNTCGPEPYQEWLEFGLAPMGITPSGYIAGNMHARVHQQIGPIWQSSLDWPGTFMMNSALVLNPDQTPCGCFESSTIGLVAKTAEGNIHFGVMLEHDHSPQPPEGDPHWTHRYTPYFGSAYFMAFRYTDLDPEPMRRSFWAITASDAGHLIWQAGLTAYLWDPATQTHDEFPVTEGINAMNAQKQVVGSLNHDDPNDTPDKGSLGFLWSPTGGMQTFHDLLPEKFRKEVRSAIPYLISNADPVTQEVEIDFEAEHWEGEPGSEQWVSKTFVLRKVPSGENVVTMEELTAEAKLAGGFIGRAAARNQAGTKVGVGTTVQLKHQVEFQAVNINKGFDLPIEGDQQPGEAGDNSEGGRKWWTRVARTTGSPFRTNNNVKVVFNNGKAKPSEYGAVAVAIGGSNLINVPGGALGAGGTLTITGPSDTSLDQAKAQILIKPLKNGQPAGNVVCALDVDVLPVRKIQLGIWFLYDATAPLIPPAYRNTTAIIDKLNEVFEQACVQFELAPLPEGQTRELNVDFDKAPNYDGKLDTTGGTMNPEGQAVLKENLPLPPKLNLLLVNAMKGNLGFTPRDLPRDRSIVQSHVGEVDSNQTPYNIDDFLITCAHEIGHALEISTRNGDRNHTGEEWLSHDAGRFPMHSYYLNGAAVPADKRYQIAPEDDTPKRLLHGLMEGGKTLPSGQWKWIRNEDWRKANERAQNFVP